MKRGAEGPGKGWCMGSVGQLKEGSGRLGLGFLKMSMVMDGGLCRCAGVWD